MKFKKIIFVITCLVYPLSAPAALAWIAYSSNIPADRTKCILPVELSQKSIVLAQNDEPRAADSAGPPANEDTDQAPDSKTADRQKSGNNSDDAATRPVKPFKPSEEIAAEQAVDFPVDI